MRRNSRNMSVHKPTMINVGENSVPKETGHDQMDCQGAKVNSTIACLKYLYLAAKANIPAFYPTDMNRTLGLNSIIGQKHFAFKAEDGWIFKTLDSSFFRNLVCIRILSSV